jgi:hypothetical protein
MDDLFLPTLQGDVADISAGISEEETTADQTLTSVAETKVDLKAA